MKYLKILSLALVATIASQNVMAIGEGAYKAADAAMAAKQGFCTKFQDEIIL